LGENPELLNEPPIWIQTYANVAVKGVLQKGNAKRPVVWKHAAMLFEILRMLSREVPRSAKQPIFARFQQKIRVSQGLFT